MWRCKLVMYQPLGEISTAFSTTLYNPYTSHPPQYNVPTGHSVLSYYPPYSHTNQLRSSPVADIPPPPPDLTSITPEVASRAMHRLITSELRDLGFDSAQLSAVKRIEIEVIACTFDLFNLPRFPVEPGRSISSRRTTLSACTRVREPVKQDWCNCDGSCLGV